MGMQRKIIMLSKLLEKVKIYEKKLCKNMVKTMDEQRKKLSKKTPEKKREE